MLREAPAEAGSLLASPAVDDDTTGEALKHSDEAHRSSQEHSRENLSAKMSDDEERVTMPFKFVTGA